MPAVEGQVLPMGRAPELAPANRPPPITPEPTTLSSALISASFSEAMEAALQRTLELNTNHVGARLLIVDNQVDAEEYAEAARHIRAVGEGIGLAL